MKRLALVFVVALAARDAGAHCSMQHLSYQVVTHTGDAIPDGGGVLVEWTSGPARGVGLDDGDPVVRTGWTWSGGGAATATSLAPGLAVYRGSGSLVDDAGKTLGTWTAGAAGDAMSAPAVKKIVRTDVKTKRRGTRTTVTADLGGAPPKDAYAIIVYSSRGVAISWALVEGGGTSFDVYAFGGHCEVSPPGMEAPEHGEKVRFAWVDRYGRVSKKSKAVKVR